MHRKSLGLLSLAAILLVGCQKDDKVSEQPQQDTMLEQQAVSKSDTKDEASKPEKKKNETPKKAEETQEEKDAKAFDNLSDGLKILVYGSVMDDRITDNEAIGKYAPMYASYECEGDDIYIYLTSGAGGTHTISHVKEREDGVKPIQIINVELIYAGKYSHASDITKADIDPVSKAELYHLYLKNREAFDADLEYVKENDETADEFEGQTMRSQIAVRGENDPIEGSAPWDKMPAERYDDYTLDDQMVMNAYALIDHCDPEYFEAEQVPNFQTDNDNADIAALYYTIKGSDVYYLMVASNGAKDVIAHAVLTDDGIMPVQVTGYDINESQAYGDENWLIDEELIDKEMIYVNGAMRLDDFREQMNDPM